MRTLDSNETDKIEHWLDRVEIFLMELQATDRAQLILDLNQQIQAQLMVNHDLKVEDVLKKMGEPMQIANRVRTERGFKPRKNLRTQSRSFGSYFLIALISVFLLFTTCTLSLPFVIPWGLNKIATNLGGQPTGTHSFHFFKDFKPWGSHGNEESDPNDLNAPDESTTDEPDTGPAPMPAPEQVNGGVQENIAGKFETSGMSAVHIQAKNTKLQISSTNNSGIDYDCKISSFGSARPFIRKSPSGIVTLALDQVAENTSCEIKIPHQVAVEILAQSGEIHLKSMSQDVLIEAANAEIHLSAGPSTYFEIEANTKKGEVKGLAEFEKKQRANKTEKRFKAKINLDAGNIFLEE